MPYGPFTTLDWAEQAVYGSVPSEHREMDEATGEPLRRVLAPFQDELALLRASADGLPSIRDPINTRGAGVTETVTVASVEAIEDSDHGDAYKVVVDGEIPLALGPHWCATVGLVNFSVVRVVSRESPSWVVLVGSGDLESVPGDEIVFAAPSMLPFLAADFGISLADGETESSQRAIISGVKRYLNWVGSPVSYRVRGDVSGFGVKAVGLYSISEGMFLSLPQDRTYRFTVAGEQRWYTDIDPVMLTWDTVAGDTFDVDMDEHVMFESDVYTSGKSPGLESSECLAEFVVTSVEVADAALYGIVDGYVLSGTVGASDYARIDVDGFSHEFALRLGDTKVYVDREVSYDSGTGALSLLVACDTSGLTLGTGTWCVDYAPSRSVGCGWCKSHFIAVVITIGDEVSERYAGDAPRLAFALGRLISILQAISPAEARVGQYALTVSGDVELDGLFADGVVARSVVVGDVFLDMVYDVFADEDDRDLDDGVLVVFKTP